MRNKIRGRDASHMRCSDDVRRRSLIECPVDGFRFGQLGIFANLASEAPGFWIGDFNSLTKLYVSYNLV